MTKKIKNKSSIKKLVFFLVAILILAGIGASWLYSNAETIIENKMKADSVKVLEKTNIPKEISEKIMVFGNPESHRVIINAQGGPMLELSGLELMGILEEEAGINKNDYFIVNVHQCQTLKTDFYSKNEMSFEDAKECDRKTVKDLAEVVKYFKNQGKDVKVLGISFGAFVVEDLLANYENIADKYIIEVGRLDMPEEVWKEFSRGNYVGFEYSESGEKKIIPFDADMAGMGGGNSIGDKNTSKIAAGLGYKRFTELLKDKNLENVVYVYGTKDEQVGRLSEEEVDFLKLKKVKLYKIESDHSGTIDEFSKKYLKDVLK